MKRTILYGIILPVFILLCCFHRSSAQYNIWGRGIGGPSVEASFGVAVDGRGNIYTTGYFYDTVDFDPGPGVAQLTSAPIMSEAFVAKFNVAGNLVWARAIGGSLDDQGRSVILDSLGNIYLAGTFQGTADFNPGPAIYNLTSAGNTDIFVCKLDTNGNFKWARGFGGTDAEVVGSITLDRFGHVYTTGSFRSTVDFDPGPAMYNLTSAGNEDIYIAKLDTAGNFVWARAMGGPYPDFADAIGVKSTGDVYTTGHFDTTADFNPGPGVYNLSVATGVIHAGFISSLDSGGNFLWAASLDAPTAQGEAHAHALKFDAHDNAYFTGGFNGTVDFDPGPGVSSQTSTAIDDIFILKLSPSNNLAWIKIVNGSQSAVNGSTAIAFDDSANVYTTGSFAGTADFNPDQGGVYNITSAGGYDIFVLKLDSMGDFRWARAMGGTGTGLDRAFDVAVDKKHDIYIVGDFQNAFDVNEATGVSNLTAHGSGEIFIDKIAQCKFVPFAVTKTGNVLTAPSYYTSYQWYRADTAISWATNATYTATQPGNYYLIASDTNGCVSQSASQTVTGIEDLVSNSSFIIYPNPGTGMCNFNINTPGIVRKLSVTLRSVTGAEVIKQQYTNISGNFLRQLDLSNLSKGIYFAEVDLDGRKTTRKLVVQ